MYKRFSQYQADTHLISDIYRLRYYYLNGSKVHKSYEHHFSNVLWRNQQEPMFIERATIITYDKDLEFQSVFIDPSTCQGKLY